ncbi:exopolysaccharide biosynthesis polyprenyl glycosylphosphotransferase [Mucilaginibacter glaciei]|uniref:Exopolysaccharide biosynthesis polyprenyl glycosylphosphotransferase n=1 Tax=Mucilaginibacter glaciei TaxID=2772109 RepID=A0A926NSS0_9SPHI|nr:exopolysaccharide biosynthesis polyprenyl glycosylphosphotransferase [Mucilaginibacter glaciei]MBD1394653.1 exopolysaccharide biosynthesis polyprenyl glycosylphosphotransferase [Mucilaginibacter glaciei]
METRNVFILIFLFSVLDLVGINCSHLLVLYLLGKSGDTISFNYVLIILLNLSWFASAYLIKLYRTKNVQSMGTILFKSILTFCFQILCIGIISAIFKSLVIDQKIVFYSLIGEFCALAQVRVFMFITEKSFQNLQNYKRKIAIVGNTELSNKVAQYFIKNKVAFNLIGHFKDDNKIADIAFGSKGGIKNTINFAIENHVDEVYTMLSSADDPALASLIEKADQHCVKLRFIASFAELEKLDGSQYHLSSFCNGVPILTTGPEPLNSIRNRIIKRLFDIGFSFFVIAFILSWLVPLLAIIIKSESKGPVFFKQLRSGKNNKPFYCYKFRSMKLNESSNYLQAAKNDARVTKVGAILRKTSVDELPQFLNVLLGDMSVVGPRPHMLSHTDQYRLIIERYMARLFFKPGITGWAQVNGHRGETTDKLQMKHRVEHDIWYIENWSIRKDIGIVYKTFLNVIHTDVNAY